MPGVKVLIFCCFICCCSTSNIDTKNTTARLWKGKVGSYFGYSVALHGRVMKENIVLVGAPLDDSVYTCSASSTNTKCEAEVVKGFRWFTRQRRDFLCKKPLINDCVLPTEIKNSHTEEAKKIKQWFGASIFTTGKHKPVVVCAPRYTTKSITRGGDFVYYLVGKCVWFNSNLENNKSISPCSKLVGTYSSCQAGFGVSYYDDSKSILFGAVESKAGTGLVILQYNAPESETFIFNDQNTFKMDYLGFAVTNGNFYSNNINEQELVSSQPRKDSNGKVLIYKVVGGKNIERKETVSPPKTVSDKKKFIYFGVSICAVDINNDGYSDLLVGAPFYRDTKGDEGRVYVYLSKTNSAGERKLTLASERMDPGLRGSNQPGARFGWTIVRAGDLNDDGFQDVIIGAPHDGPDLEGDGMGNGAIYIYYGLTSGDIKGFQQKITAMDMKKTFSVNLKQFGYAVSGNVDTDGNEYPDIAIGCWQSDKVILLRTRPIIKIEASITLTKSKIPVENFTANCLDGSTERQCLNATVCFKYLGKNVSGIQGYDAVRNRAPTGNVPINYSMIVVLDYTFKLDTFTDNSKRVFLRNDDNEKIYENKGSVTLAQKDENVCQNFNNIFIEDSTLLWNSLTRGNKIVFEVEYKLRSNRECDLTKLCPALDKSRAPHSAQEKAILISKCSNNTCDYDLFVKLRANTETITIGQTPQKVTVQVTLGNKEEKYFYPEIIINHEPSLHYENIIVGDKNVRIDKEIPRNSKNELRSERFILQGALESRKRVVFLIQYSTINVTGNKRILTIDVETNGTSGPESNITNNKDSIYFHVIRDVEISIAARSVPTRLTYFSNVNASSVGLLVNTTFVLSNNGKSPLQSINFKIIFPFREKGKNKKQKYIMYPVGINYPLDNGKCEAPKFNPEPIEIAHKKIVLNFQNRPKRAAIEYNAHNKENETITCIVKELKSKKHVTVGISFRLWVNTLSKHHPNDLLLIIFANAEYQDPIDGKRISAELKIPVNALKPPIKKKTISIWIIIVAILGGVLLLALAIIALFKCGFFKRNRPPTRISLISNDDHEDAANVPS